MAQLHGAAVWAPALERCCSYPQLVYTHGEAESFPMCHGEAELLFVPSEGPSSTPGSAHQTSALRGFVHDKWLRSIVCIGLQQRRARLVPSSRSWALVLCCQAACDVLKLFLFLCPSTAQFRASHSGIKVWAPVLSSLQGQICKPT